MPTTTVILPVETKVREYHGKLFLALQLLRRGYPVLFGEQARLWLYSDLVDPGIYLDKSVAQTHANWSARCRAHGHRIVSLDEEGLIFFDAEMYRKLRVDPSVFAALDSFFAWGEVHRDAVLEIDDGFAEKIKVCGNPRFDLLRPELREVYRARANEIKSRYGKILLVNTNFALHNHFRSQADVRSMLSHYPLASEPGYMDGWIEMHRTAHETYLEMVPQLKNRYPGHTVIIRPHPSENHFPWQELVRTCPGVHVDASGNVHEWILASETVIHFNCTTAVEAFFLGVQAIAYRPGRFPRYENHLPNALSENAFTLQELWAAIDGRFTAKERGVLWTDSQWVTARRYVAGLEGLTASERIGDAIACLAASLPPYKRTLAKRFLTEAKRRWRLQLHRYREARFPPDGYLKQKFPGLDAREVRSDLTYMADLLGLSMKFKIRPFAKNCVLLEPKQ
jgi:surface carbohydrate biosynthesis protein